MSSTRSPSPKEPATSPARRRKRRPSPGLWLLLYPFTLMALGTNLFMLGLLWQAIGWPALSPMTTLWLSLPLGAVANVWVARWVRGLIDEAEGRD